MSDGSPQNATIPLALQIVSLAFGILIAVGIVVPFEGILVRYRANYTPKGLRLPEIDPRGGEYEDTDEPRVGPVVKSLWAMFKRVCRLEGPEGFYKNIIPALTLSLVTAGLQFIPASNLNYPLVKKVVHPVVTEIIWIPAAVLANRVITTPYRLGYFSPKESIRAIFTPHERQNPQLLWFTPGLIPAAVTQTLWLIGLRALRGFTPMFNGPFYPPERWNFSPVGVAVFFITAGLSTLIISPLNVAIIRLSIQRNHPKGETASDADKGLATYSDEEVIGRRSEDDPYLGLLDCIKRIVAEEGRATLFRAWWLTLLRCLLS